MESAVNSSLWAIRHWHKLMRGKMSKIHQDLWSDKIFIQFEDLPPRAINTCSHYERQVTSDRKNERNVYRIYNPLRAQRTRAPTQAHTYIIIIIYIFFNIHFSFLLFIVVIIYIVFCFLFVSCFYWIKHTVAMTVMDFELIMTQ